MTNIQVSAWRTGGPVTVSWAADPGEVEFALARKTDLDASFRTVYEGAATTYADAIPSGASSVIYRLSAIQRRTTTWDEIDALSHDWDHYDTLGWTWYVSQSGFILTGEITPEPDLPPVISGEDEDLGSKYAEFVVDYSVYDVNEYNTVSVRVLLDGSVSMEIRDAVQNQIYEFAVTAGQLLEWAHNGAHTIEIVATNTVGLESVRVYTFTVVEDIITDATYYVLRDDIPVAKLQSANEWTDYMAVGTHRYRIRAVDKYDRYADSNEVEVTILVASSTLALASAPNRLLVLPVRMESKPQRSLQYDMGFVEEYYENRPYAIARKTARRGKAVTAVLSTRTKEEYDQLLEILLAAELVVYRDPQAGDVAATIHRRFAARER